MSFGSISKEAHETLAIAMNRIGGKSNTGEGGEDEERFERPNGDRSSAIKQVASGRFGVTANYLVNADELQIKMAQGAKPGEGGQLPGHKVDEIDRAGAPLHPRRAADLAAAAPRHLLHRGPGAAHLRPEERQPARAHLGEAGGRGGRGHGGRGRGQGARRRGADQRRHDGGTGASPLTSIKHAGIPWELGLAETQQVLVMNDLRSRIRVQTDGKLQTGRDVVIARAAGRRGVRLRHRAAGGDGLHHDAQVPPQHLPGGHRHAGPGAAQEVPRHARARDQLLLLRGRGGARATWPSWASARSTRWSAAWTCSRCARPSITGRRKGLDFSAILYSPQVPGRVARRCVQPQDHGLDQALDYKLIDHAARSPRKRHAGRVRAAHPQRPPHRGRHAERRSRASATAPPACPTTPSSSTSPARPGRASARFWPRASR